MTSSLATDVHGDCYFLQQMSSRNGPGLNSSEFFREANVIEDRLEAARSRSSVFSASSCSGR